MDSEVGLRAYEFYFAADPNPFLPDAEVLVA